MNTDYIPIPTGVGKKENAPGAITGLILGIVALANMAFFGWIPAIIGMNYCNKALRAIEENPLRYSENSQRMAKTGKTMSTIGLVMGIIGMFVTFFYYYWIFSTAYDNALNHNYYY